jgi:hypothetical protein
MQTSPQLDARTIMEGGSRGTEPLDSDEDVPLVDLFKMKVHSKAFVVVLFFEVLFFEGHTGNHTHLLTLHTCVQTKCLQGERMLVILVGWKGSRRWILL